MKVALQAKIKTKKIKGAFLPYHYTLYVLLQVNCLCFSLLATFKKQHLPNDKFFSGENLNKTFQLCVKINVQSL